MVKTFLIFSAWLALAYDVTLNGHTNLPVWWVLVPILTPFVVYIVAWAVVFLLYLVLRVVLW